MSKPWSSSATQYPMTSPGDGCSRPATRSRPLLLEQGRIEEAEAVYRSDLGLGGKLSLLKTFGSVANAF
jgi:hypothetical protein